MPDAGVQNRAQTSVVPEQPGLVYGRGEYLDLFSFSA